MSDDPSALDRSLLRRLDGMRPGGATQPVSAQPVPSARIDIANVLEAVQHAANAMTSMAERIRELEAHTEAFLASNLELEEHNRRLTADVAGVVQQRDGLAADLEIETARAKRLEEVAAQNVMRGTSLEREFEATHSDLTRIVQAIRTRLGA